MTLERSLDTAAAVDAEQRLQQMLVDIGENSEDTEEDEGDNQAPEVSQGIAPIAFFDNTVFETAICGSPDSRFGPQQTIDIPETATVQTTQPGLSTRMERGSDTPSSTKLPSPLTTGTADAVASISASTPAAAAQAKLSPQKDSECDAATTPAPAASIQSTAVPEKPPAKQTLWSQWMGRRPNKADTSPAKIEPARPLQAPNARAAPASETKEAAASYGADENHTGRTRHIFRGRSGEHAEGVHSAGAEDEEDEAAGAEQRSGRTRHIFGGGTSERKGAAPGARSMFLCMYCNTAPCAVLCCAMLSLF